MEFLQIRDPRKPDDYLVIARRDFDPAVHVPYVPGHGSASPVPSPKARPKAAKE